MDSNLLTLDGRQGEGGGQVLRTSLSLSAALGRPIRIVHIRGGRSKPGLMRQHRTAARAVCEITDGQLAGDELGSTELEFTPGAIRAGEYRFAIGTAGSAMLVLQTVLPVLLCADGESTVVVEGGTHNPWAPPFEALDRSFRPLLERMGASLSLELHRPGFYPAGGGSVTATIRPASSPQRLELLDRGPRVSRKAEVLLAHLSDVIGRRELEVLFNRLPWVAADAPIVRCDDSAGPGNVALATLTYRDITEVFVAFGEKSVSAERVAKSLARRVRGYEGLDAPVGAHLADQLMLPMALLAGGTYRTTFVSKHTETNLDVINTFAPGTVSLEEEQPVGGRIDVQPLQP